jgi:hypothetical protein
VVVLVLVGLYIYLEIDKKRFIESLPRLEPEVLQTLDSAPSVIRTSVDEVKQIELGKVMTDKEATFTDAEEVLESFRSAETSVHEWEIAGLDAVTEPEENPLSPEIEALFSKYHALREKRRFLAAELGPMQLEHISIIDEISEIMTDEGDISADGVSEANARLTRGKELAPLIFELQDESEQLSEEFTVLLGEYGVSSEAEFHQTHREAYKAWVAVQ